MAHALVVDDEKNVQKTVSITLSRAGHNVDTASSGEEAIEKIGQRLYDLVITDLRMGAVDGLAVLQAVKDRDPETEVLLMSAYGSIDSAVRAMRGGAHDFLEKPFTPDELLHTVELALERRGLRSEVTSLRRAVEDPNDPDAIVGSSEPILKVIKDAEGFAQSDSTILITGETGTGKDLLARTIQRHSHRASRPYMVVNCATIPKTLFESELFGHVKGAYSGATRNRKGLTHEAHQGTLFLDEIGEMPLDVQPQLLRFLESGEIRPVGQNTSLRVDVRVIAATNRDLRAMVEAGEFREDLFYRLDVLRLHLPPLRERRSDIDEIVDRLVTRLARRMGIPSPKLSAELLSHLRSYEWPGNVRELQNVVERGMTLARARNEALGPSHMVIYERAGPREVGAIEGAGIGELISVSEIEKRHVLAVLKNCGNNQRKSARILGISKSTLWRKLREYGIEASPEP